MVHSFLVFALFLSSCVGSGETPDGVLRAKNMGTLSAEEVSVKICDNAYKLENISPGEEKSFSYFISGDCNYKVSVKFKDGKVLETEEGYLTRGMISQDTLIINNNELRIHQDQN